MTTHQPGHDVRDFCVPPEAPLRDAAACMNRNRKGIAVATDAEGRLLGTVTDGDIRRALLAGRGLDTPVSVLLAEKGGAAPVTAAEGTPSGDLLRLMQERAVHQVPLLDAGGRVVGLATLEDLLPQEVQPLRAVIMAGGYGKRLYPLTERTPKPMLPVGDRPLIQHTIDQLRDAGIHRVSITTHYQSERIAEHFGDGAAFGVSVDYVTEEQPLGTAGSLSLLKDSDEPLLVVNGDILTRIDFRALLSFHREQRADLTVGVRKYDLNVPYGVVECEGAAVRRLAEKPVYGFLINAGIYLVEPSARRFVPSGRRFDMTDMIQALLDRGRPVVSFPILEYWLDVGCPDDYLRAQKDVKGWAPER